MNQVTPSVEEKSLAKELTKRRVFAFFLFLTAFSFAQTIGEEIDKPSHALDDIVVVLVAVVGFILILLWWKRKSLSSLKRQHNVFLVIALVVLAMKLMAFVIESSDAQDLGNDIPGLIFAVMMIANRFV